MENTDMLASKVASIFPRGQAIGGSDARLRFDVPPGSHRYRRRLCADDLFGQRAGQCRRPNPRPRGLGWLQNGDAGVDSFSTRNVDIEAVVRRRGFQWYFFNFFGMTPDTVADDVQQPTAASRRRRPRRAGASMARSSRRPAYQFGGRICRHGLRRRRLLRSDLRLQLGRREQRQWLARVVVHVVGTHDH